MTIEEKVCEIMLSEEFPDNEKLDRLHALIPPDVFKIDNLNRATPAQLRQLKDGLAITEAMQQLRRPTLLAKKQSENADNNPANPLKDNLANAAWRHARKILAVSRPFGATSRVFQEFPLSVVPLLDCGFPIFIVHQNSACIPKERLRSISVNCQTS